MPKKPKKGKGKGKSKPGKTVSFRKGDEVQLHSLKKVEMNGLKGVVQEDFTATLSAGARAMGGQQQQPQRCTVTISGSNGSKTIAVKGDNLRFIRAGELDAIPKVKDMPRHLLQKMVAWAERTQLGAKAKAAAAKEGTLLLSTPIERIESPLRRKDLESTMKRFLAACGEGALASAGKAYLLDSKGKDGVQMRDDDFASMWGKKTIGEQVPECAEHPYFHISADAQAEAEYELGCRSAKPGESMEHTFKREFAEAEEELGAASIPMGDPKGMSNERLVEVIAENAERSFGALTPSHAASERAELASLKAMVAAGRGAEVRPMLLEMVEGYIAANIHKMKQYHELKRAVDQLDAVAAGKVEEEPESEDKLAPQLRTPIPKSLDGAATLMAWPDSKPIDQVFSVSQFSYQEKVLNGSVREVYDAGEDPNFKVREVLCRIADGITRHKGRVYAVQPESREIGCILRVGDTKMLRKQDADQKSTLDVQEFPVLECFWYFGEKGHHLEETLAAVSFLTVDASDDADPNSPANGMAGITAYKSGVELFRDLLKKNRKRLDPAYRDKMEKCLPEGVKFSLLTPVEAMQLNTEVCAGCKNVAKSLKRCAGCGIPGYCGTECQRLHWPTHKSECKKKIPADSDLALVDLKVSDPFGAPGLVTRGVSLNQSSLGGQGAVYSSNEGTRIPSRWLGAKVIVKVQVPMTETQSQGLPDVELFRRLGGSMRESVSCMIYDETRTWSLQASAKNTAVGFDAMVQMVRSRGEMGGLKAYFKAWLPTTPDGIVKIDYKKVLKAQPW